MDCRIARLKFRGIADYIDSIFLGLQGETSKLGNSIFTFSLASAGGLFAVIIYAILVPIMIFFMLFDKETINGWISKFFPEKLDLTQKAYKELNLKIGNYIRCKLIEIIIVPILVFDKSGSIYFTDPPYGLKIQDDDPLKELDFNGIYRWSESEGIELLSKSMKRPNGIILSEDEKTVYAVSYTHLTLPTKRIV